MFEVVFEVVVHDQMRAVEGDRGGWGYRDWHRNSWRLHDSIWERCDVVIEVVQARRCDVVSEVVYPRRCDVVGEVVYPRRCDVVGEVVLARRCRIVYDHPAPAPAPVTAAVAVVAVHH